MFNIDYVYAGNPQAEPFHLEILARSVYPSIRSKVAENPTALRDFLGLNGSTQSIGKMPALRVS
jgi:hypothetical protein